MGFLSQRYIPHCCLVYITEKKNYLTKIIKCDEQSIVNDFGSIDIFKKKIEIGELYERNLSLYERSRNGDEIYVWECKPINREQFLGEYVCIKNPIDIFFGIGEGRVYIEEGRFNTEKEGKKKVFDDSGYLIDNPNYKFKKFEKDNELFRYCKLG